MPTFLNCGRVSDRIIVATVRRGSLDHGMFLESCDRGWQRLPIHKEKAGTTAESDGQEEHAHALALSRSEVSGFDRPAVATSWRLSLITSATNLGPFQMQAS